MGLVNCILTTIKRDCRCIKMLIGSQTYSMIDKEKPKLKHDHYATVLAQDGFGKQNVPGASD